MNRDQHQQQPSNLVAEIDDILALQRDLTGEQPSLFAVPADSPRGHHAFSATAVDAAFDSVVNGDGVISREEWAATAGKMPTANPLPLGKPASPPLLQRRQPSNDSSEGGGGTFIRQRRALGALTTRCAWSSEGLSHALATSRSEPAFAQRFFAVFQQFQQARIGTEGGSLKALSDTVLEMETEMNVEREVCVCHVALRWATQCTQRPTI